MIKTLNRTLKQDREKFTLPKNVQDIIPVQSVYPDGIFQTGKNKFSKTFRFEDIFQTCRRRAHGTLFSDGIRLHGTGSKGAASYHI